MAVSTASRSTGTTRTKTDIRHRVRRGTTASPGEQARLHPDRIAIAVIAVATALAIWRPAADPFSIPKALVVVGGAAALILLALVRWIRDGVVAIPRSAVTLAATAFVAALSFSVITSDNTTASLVGVYKRYDGFVLYAACVVLLMAVLRAFTPATIRTLVLAQAVAGGVVVAYGVIQWRGIDPLDWEQTYGDAVFSTLGNPNFAGAYAGMTFPLMLWGVVRDGASIAGRVIFGALALCAVATAIASDSVQGPATVAIGGGVFVLAFVISRRGWVAKAGVPLMIAAAIGGGAVAIAGFNGSGPLARLEQEATLEIRRVYWGAAWSMFEAEPMTGVGMDRYHAFYRAHRAEDAANDISFTVNADQPHNVPLDMLAEGGLPLGGAYAFFVLLTGSLLLYGLVRLRGTNLLMLGALGGTWAAYQAQSLVSIDLAPLAAVHWLTAGGIAVLARPPRMKTFRLPWGGAAAAGRRAAAVPSETRGAVGAILAGALAIVGLWFLVLPLRADAALGDSQQAVVNKNATGAIEAAKRSTDLAGWEGTYWFQYGVRMLDAGRQKEAMTALEHAIEREPRGLEQVVTGARISAALGDEKRAADLYAQALRIEPHAPEMLLEVAKFRAVNGDFAAAQKALESVVEVRPSDSEAWLVLGQVYAEQENLPKARAALERVVSLGADNAEVSLLLARVYALEGNLVGAREAVERSVAADPKIADAWKVLGQVAGQAGDLPRAGEALDEAVALDADDAEAWFVLAKVRAQQEKLPEAATALERVVSLDADNADAWLLYGQVLAIQEKLPEAATALEKATSLNDKAIDGWLSLGKVYARSERFADAKRAFQRVVALDPAHAEANNILQLLANAGK